MGGVMLPRRFEEGVFTRRRGDAEKKGGERSFRSDVRAILHLSHVERLRREARAVPQARPNLSHLLLR
ncbi:hypothetical protein ACTGUZ_11225, partial [Streptococcus suis]